MIVEMNLNRGNIHKVEFLFYTGEHKLQKWKFPVCREKVHSAPGRILQRKILHPEKYELRPKLNTLIFTSEISALLKR